MAKMEIWDDGTSVKVTLPLIETRAHALLPGGQSEGVIDWVTLSGDTMANEALTDEVPKVCLHWMRGRYCASFFQMGLETALEFGLALVARSITAKRQGDSLMMAETLRKLRAFVDSL